MANINDVFPTKYLSAADLQKRTVRLAITSVTVETLGQGRDQQSKPVLYFRGKTKGLALNKTNANTIANVYGYETDNWIGAEIDVYPAMVDYQGKQVEAIRLRVVPLRGGGAQAPLRQEPPVDDRPMAPPHDAGRPMINDDIPF
jgi:hypothetical protein